MPSLASLIVAETKAEIYARGLAMATALGLPVTSWAPGDPTRSLYFYLAETLEIFLQAGPTGTAAGAVEHGTSAEAVLAVARALLTAIGTALGAPGAPVTALAVDAAFAALVATMAATTLPALSKAALLTALAAKVPDTGGDTPTLGWPAVRGG